MDAQYQNGINFALSDENLLSGICAGFKANKYSCWSYCERTDGNCELCRSVARHIRACVSDNQKDSVDT